jgi:hypothetical protein
MTMTLLSTKSGVWYVCAKRCDIASSTPPVVIVEDVDE